MKLYALVDDRLPARRPLEQLIELYDSRKNAEATLDEVLRDEPAWLEWLRVVELPKLLGARDE